MQWKKTNMAGLLELCELWSDREWARVSQRETSPLHVCDGNMGCAHRGVCVCVPVYACQPSRGETDVMQRLRNLFRDFFKQASVGFLALMHHSRVFDFSPPPPTPPSSTCYDWLQLWWHSMKRLRCCVFTSWQCRMSQYYFLWVLVFHLIVVCLMNLLFCAEYNIYLISHYQPHFHSVPFTFTLS